MLAANEDELMEMITAGAEKIINTNEECIPPFAIHLIIPDLCNGSLMFNNNINAIILCREECTVELK
jgi:hypothetical protein